jgi:hypothetical protein
VSAGHAVYLADLAKAAWSARYEGYQRDCAEWGVSAQPFEDFKAYWDIFARDGELLLNASAPILVQRL